MFDSSSEQLYDYIAIKMGIKILCRQTLTNWVINKINSLLTTTLCGIIYVNGIFSIGTIVQLCRNYWNN